VTSSANGYETYPGPADFVAPKRWEQPVFAAAQPSVPNPEEHPVASAMPAVGEREIES